MALAIALRRKTRPGLSYDGRLSRPPTSRSLGITAVIASLDAGGAERVLATLASGWAARGHRVTILTLDDGPIRQTLSSLVTRIPLGLAAHSTSLVQGVRNNVHRIGRLRRALAESAAEVIVSFGDQTNVATLAASLGLSSPVIVSERTSPDHHVIGRPWRMMRRRLYPRAARVVVQTERTREAIVSWAGPRVVVLPNPVAVSTAPDVIAPQDARDMVAVGRLVPSKAFDLLLRAFVEAEVAASGWRLTIVGDGPERSRLDQLAIELGIADHVTFTGYVPNPDDIVRRAGVFVTATRYEGFPNALAEAMAAGRPVIATDCPTGPRELTLNGTAGVLVPVDDVPRMAAAIRELCANGPERARLGAAARAAMRPYAVEGVVSAWEAMFSVVLAEASR